MPKVPQARLNGYIDRKKIEAAQNYVAAYNDYERTVKETGWASPKSKLAFKHLVHCDKAFKRWAAK